MRFELLKKERNFFKKMVANKTIILREHILKKIRHNLDNVIFFFLLVKFVICDIIKCCYYYHYKRYKGLVR